MTIPTESKVVELLTTYYNKIQNGEIVSLSEFREATKNLSREDSAAMVDYLCDPQSNRPWEK